MIAFSVMNKLIHLTKIVSKSMKHTLFEKKFDPLLVRSKKYFDPLKNLYDLYSVGSK